MNDAIAYLNRGESSPMGHKLLDLIAASAQQKAPARQWRAWLAGLGQKGVKAAELKMAGLDEFLGAQDDCAAVTKEVLQAEAAKNMVTIKEVALGTPLFAAYRHAGGKYKEFLYIANSERDCMRDEIDVVQFEIEDLNFHMDRLMEDPTLLSRLEERLNHLRKTVSGVPDFSAHHYTEAVAGRNGKNLVAHARVSVHGDLYFMDEVQSDWAQQGRKGSGFYRDGAEISRFEAGTVPVGPYVKDTEEWAGLVLRRHAALAAANPEIKRFAWITGGMRNGGVGVRADNLDKFYLEIVPKIMNKVIGKAGAKVEMVDVRLGDKTFKVPGFEMTDKVRARLLERQPMYSRMNLEAGMEPSDELKSAVLRQCKGMLGSLAQVRIIDRCYDISTGARVAGKYTHKVLLLSEEAEDLPYQGNHEAFHAACDLMMSDHEREMVLDRFAPGRELNFAVKDELIRSGNHAAAAQCEIAEEAAAHGFALWRAKRLDVREDKEPALIRVFHDIADGMKMLGRWVRKNVFDQGYQTPAELFDAIANGELAERRAKQLREYHGQR